ncbi:unnamed protein product [marine sediment metagenome]|uniref:Uncharacterized protein n=1 Tax=marine sediment metagenome TaxID=412755 RepID=X0WTL9_9ZZZZ
MWICEGPDEIQDELLVLESGLVEDAVAQGAGACHDQKPPLPVVIGDQERHKVLLGNGHT